MNMNNMIVLKMWGLTNFKNCDFLRIAVQLCIQFVGDKTGHESLGCLSQMHPHPTSLCMCARACECVCLQLACLSMSDTRQMAKPWWGDALWRIQKELEDEVKAEPERNISREIPSETAACSLGGYECVYMCEHAYCCVCALGAAGC